MFDFNSIYSKYINLTDADDRAVPRARCDQRPDDDPREPEPDDRRTDGDPAPKDRDDGR